MLRSIIRNVTLLIVFTVIAIAALDELSFPTPERGPGETAARHRAVTKVAATGSEGRADPGAGSDDHGGQTLVLDAGPGGHFFVEATVNYERVNFLVDTGASMIALSRADAERLGLDLYGLDYRFTVSTANGTARVARVLLDEVAIGDIVVEKVPAAVVEGDLEISLLGMSFLSRLSGFEVRDNQLIMRW